MSTQELPLALDARRRPPNDRFCDVVLKGGVVDGVIYPGAIIEIAREYRFQSLAGTSVGAIAAAFTAACEYSRRFGSDAGFNEVMRKVPDELASPSEGNPKQTMLRALFQPMRGTERLFNMVVTLFSEMGGTKFLPWVVVKTILSSYAGLMLAVFALAVLIGYFFANQPLAWFEQLLSADLIVNGDSEAIRQTLLAFAKWALWPGWIIGLMFALAALVFQLLREFKKLRQAPGFGFCSGKRQADAKDDSFIEWMQTAIQGAARLPLDRPLTFDDLWKAPAGPINSSGVRSAKSIDLRMVTTCVSHGRPYELPLANKASRLFFRLSEWQDFFPEPILHHLKVHAKLLSSLEQTGYVARNSQDPKGSMLWSSPDPKDPAYADIYELPTAQLPVLVAVRLSMNFPILFQAIPMWAIDNEAGPIPNIAGAPELRRVWFTDGGVTSNFPIQTFDSPLPRWPTFGIYVRDKNRSNSANHKSRDVQLPEFHTTGHSERWLLDEGFFGFLANMLTSAKDWADTVNLRMPGTSDRVATVFLNNVTKGGLDLLISPQAIRHLGYHSGVQAGLELVQKFSRDPVPANPQLSGAAGWLDHRWVRLNTYVMALKKHVTGFSEATGHAKNTSDISTQIVQAGVIPPLKTRRFYERTIEPHQADALNKAIDAIRDLELALNAQQLDEIYAIQPRPNLQTRAQL